MTKEEKELLIKDLCARLPYGVKGIHRGKVHKLFTIDGREINNACIQVDGYDAWFSVDTFKPYLRPLSSMSEEEYERCEDDTGFSFGAGANKESFNVYDYIVIDECGCIEISIKEIVELITWLYKNQFDVNHLIEKGLALEAPDGMYKEE